MITITEKDLLQRLVCPARSNSLVSPSGEESALLSCAESICRWIIEEFANNRQPTALDTIRYFDGVWEQTAYFRSRDAIPLEQYNKALRKGIRACRRLRDILWRCEILQPVLPYELQVGGIAIRGEYCILRSSRRKKKAFALYLRHGGVKKMPLVPDVVSFARRLDLGNRWLDNGKALTEWGVNSMAIMHYWIGQELQAEHVASSQESVDVLGGTAGVVAGPKFPIPGRHCRGCCRPCRNDLPASVA